MEIEYDSGDAGFLQSTMPALADSFRLIGKSFVIIHEFAIKAGSETIKAAFSITDEYFKIAAPFDPSLVALTIHHQGNGLKVDVNRGVTIEISEKLESLIGGIVDNADSDSAPALPSYQLFSRIRVRECHFLNCTPTSFLPSTRGSFLRLRRVLFWKSTARIWRLSSII